MTTIKPNKLQLHSFWHKTDRQYVLESLKASPGLWAGYRSLEQNSEWQEWFIDFLSGEKIMPILYDSFFKRLFHLGCISVDDVIIFLLCLIHSGHLYTG